MLKTIKWANQWALLSPTSCASECFFKEEKADLYAFLFKVFGK